LMHTKPAARRAGPRNFRFFSAPREGSFNMRDCRASGRGIPPLPLKKKKRRRNVGEGRHRNDSAIRALLPGVRRERSRESRGERPARYGAAASALE
jgi:hypothetical protein